MSKKRSITEFESENEFLEKYRRIYRERMQRAHEQRLRYVIAKQAKRIAAGDEHFGYDRRVRTALGNLVQVIAGVTRYVDIPDEQVDILIDVTERLADVVAQERRTFLEQTRG